MGSSYPLTFRIAAYQPVLTSSKLITQFSPEITKHRVAIESASSAVSRAGSSHMITVLTALHDLIH